MPYFHLQNIVNPAFFYGRYLRYYGAGRVNFLHSGKLVHIQDDTPRLNAQIRNSSVMISYQTRLTSFLLSFIYLMLTYFFMYSLSLQAS